MNLESIIQEIKRNRTGAERKLFDISSNRLLAVAIRYVYDENAAKDVLQEAYIRIYNSIGRFNYNSEAETWSWMNRITSREALRWLKKQKRSASLKDEIVEVKAFVHQTHSFAEDDKFILLQSLKYNEKIAFIMFAIEGYSHEEVAQELGIAQSSSRSLVTRARKKLQTQLLKIDSYEQQQLQ